MKCFGLFLVSLLSSINFATSAFAQSEIDPRRTSTNAMVGFTLQGPRFNPNTGMPIPSDFVVQRVRQQGGTKVPILVPFAWTQTESTAETMGFKLKAEVNNYTAIFRPPGMSSPIDIVIDGTIEVVRSRTRELRAQPTRCRFLLSVKCAADPLPLNAMRPTIWFSFFAAMICRLTHRTALKKM